MQIHPINPETVEDVIRWKPPWYVENRDYRKGDHRYYGVCPYCSNPIQLVALYKASEKLNRPHGRHVPKPVEGVGVYDEVAKLDCPYFRNNRPLRKSRRRAVSPLANAIQDIAVEHFVQCIEILSSDFGFRPSYSRSANMLDVWFSAQGYLYTGAHLRNVPWMIAYFAQSENLYGQVIPANTDLARALVEKVPAAMFNESGQLQTRGDFISLDFNCTHHRRTINKDGSMSETIELFVQDYTHTQIPRDAPVVFKKKIVMDQDLFQRLIATPPARTRRNQNLMDIAREVASCHR